MAPRNTKLNLKDSKVNLSAKKQVTVKSRTKKPNSDNKVNPKRNLVSEKTKVSPVFQEASAGASSSTTQRVARGKRTLEATVNTLPEIQNVSASARRSRIPRPVARSKNTLRASEKTLAEETASFSRNLRSTSRNRDLRSTSRNRDLRSTSRSRDLRSTSRSRDLRSTSRNRRDNIQENQPSTSRETTTNAKTKRTLAAASGQTLSVTPSRINSKKRVAISKKKRTPKVTEIASTSSKRPLKRQRTVEERSCVICLDTVRNSRFKSTPCQHWFHNKCLNEWLSKSTTCPTCRFVLKDTPPQPESRTFESIFNGFVHLQLPNNFNIDLATGIVTITL